MPKKQPKPPLAKWPKPKDEPPGADKYFIRLWGDSAELGERAKARLAKFIAKNIGAKPEQIGLVVAGAADATKPDAESKRGGVEGGTTTQKRD